MFRESHGNIRLSLVNFLMLLSFGSDLHFERFERVYALSCKSCRHAVRHVGFFRLFFFLVSVRRLEISSIGIVSFLMSSGSICFAAKSVISLVILRCFGEKQPFVRFLCEFEYS